MDELILIVDFNWLALSRLFPHEKLFKKDNSDPMKQAGANNFTEMIARSLSGVLYKIPQLTGIVLVADGGSWRKSLPIPEQLQDTTYKGNRESDTEMDWDLVWGTVENFLNHAAEVGITVSKQFNIEGDDWAWYWSRKLNEQGKNTIIWTSDQDLQQLVQVRNNTVTAWWNDRSGLKLPLQCQPSDDPLAYMINPPFYNSCTLGLSNTLRDVDYINGDEIVINKVLCGDSGDNIKSVVRFEKNGRTYRFSTKDYERIQNELNLESVADLREQEEDIITHIQKSSKFKKYKFDDETIREMLDYNLNLVWLNEAILPEPILQAMVGIEYKDFNIQSLKDNFKLLVPGRSTEIEDIFKNVE